MYQNTVRKKKVIWKEQDDQNTIYDTYFISFTRVTTLSTIIQNFRGICLHLNFN